MEKRNVMTLLMKVLKNGINFVFSFPCKVIYEKIYNIVINPTKNDIIFFIVSDNFLCFSLFHPSNTGNILETQIKIFKNIPIDKYVTTSAIIS